MSLVEDLVVVVALEVVVEEDLQEHQFQIIHHGNLQIQHHLPNLVKLVKMVGP
jgi:hypothetical protein